MMVLFIYSLLFIFMLCYVMYLFICLLCVCVRVSFGGMEEWDFEGERGWCLYIYLTVFQMLVCIG